MKMEIGEWRWKKEDQLGLMRPITLYLIGPGGGKSKTSRFG